MPIPTTTLEGRLTDDPQRNQHNPNLVEFTIAEGTRYQDKQTGQWRDGPTLFAHCKVWDATLGNNILNTLRKGVEVVAIADIRQNSWTDRQTGQKRNAIEFNVSNIAPSLRRATAQVVPNPRRNDGQQSQGYGSHNAGDPWGSSRDGGRQDADEEF